MAQIPSQEQVEKIKAETQTAIDNKTKSQISKGKDFIPHDGGVIPEKYWNNLKDKK